MSLSIFPAEEDERPARVYPSAEAPSTLSYEPFYGLREKAFSLSADPRFLYKTPAHGLALDELCAGIRRREGLIVLTGEIGTGKTTLCRSVLQHLDWRTFAAFVADPFVSREDLLKTLLVQFGVVSIGDLTRGRFNGASRSELSYPLYEFLDSLVPLEAFAVVVIDEAQNISLPLLEEIRILSELERREKLLQVVLVGQPELRASLKLPEMRQVDQRVSVRCELTALAPDAVACYVDHRLKIAAAGTARVEVTVAAIQAVYAGSSGVPRLINRICDRAFQRAFATRSVQIDAPFVWAAIEDLGLTPAVDVPDPAPQPQPADAALPPLTVSAPPPPAPAEPTQVEQETDDRPRAAAGPESRNRTVASPTTRRGATRSRGRIALAGSLFVVCASLAGVVRYTGVVGLNGDAVAALPAPPRPVAAQPVAPPPHPTASSVAAGVAAGAPQQPPIEANSGRALPADGMAAGEDREYTILVASFRGPERAERLVRELATAGYRAHTVERDGGPMRGRFVQVMISGYTSPVDVQRDLHRIRRLPGGYTDAQVIEQEGPKQTALLR